MLHVQTPYTTLLFSNLPSLAMLILFLPRESKTFALNPTHVLFLLLEEDIQVLLDDRLSSLSLFRIYTFDTLDLVN